jgi:hypothetical protein
MRGGTEMKKTLVIATILAVGVITLRRFGPALAKRARAKCEEMMRTRAGAREKLVDARASAEESASRIAV